MSAMTKLVGAVLLSLLCWPVGNTLRHYTEQGGWGIALVEEDVRIAGPSGRYTIAARIVRPAGGGPYGGIILNHGVPLTAAARRLESADLLRDAAALLASRGYAVVLPLRRGFGATGGAFAEHAGSCTNPDYARGESAAADDVMAAYEFARRLPYVDGSRMILAGQSAGGVAALYAAGTRSPKGLVAVLAFAPGRGGDPVAHPGVPCALEPLAEVFADLGKRVRVPVLFHYAANDLFFGASASQLWFKRFSAGGARAELVLQPAFGQNGHYIFSDDAGARYWAPAVEQFLRKHDVPFGAAIPATST